MNPPVLSLPVKLVYRHGLGRFAPYFEALTKGKALAARCPACNRVWFPPRQRCPEHGTPTENQMLAGTGTVAATTAGPGRLPFADQDQSHGFILVAMDGADNLAFGRIASPAEAVAPGLRVRLAGSTDAPHPAQAALFVAEEKA